MYRIQTTLPHSNTQLYKFFNSSRTIRWRMLNYISFLTVPERYDDVCCDSIPYRTKTEALLLHIERHHPHCGSGCAVLVYFPHPRRFWRKTVDRCIHPFSLFCVHTSSGRQYTTNITKSSHSWWVKWKMLSHFAIYTCWPYDNQLNDVYTNVNDM